MKRNRSRFNRLIVFLEIVGWFLVEGVKTAMDERLRERARPGVCVRKRRCRIDGPCNGLPRKRLANVTIRSQRLERMEST